MLGISLRAFHQKRPSLPAPVQLGQRIVRWRRDDLRDWVRSLATVHAARSEPEQLARGKARLRVSTLPDGAKAVESQAPGPETQERRQLGLPPVPSNP